MKEFFSPIDNAGELLSALKNGALLTVKNGDRINSMTIGWGSFGINWSRPVFTVYVRESRFSRELLDANPEFTVSLPDAQFNKEILKFCGSRSGRDVDKAAALGLHYEKADKISVPGVKELPLTLECRVLYRAVQEDSRLPEDIQDRFYPRDSQGRQDRHIAYYGQIVSAYRITD